MPCFIGQFGSNVTTDIKQARLLQRYWIAAGSSILVLLFMYALHWNRYLDERGFYYAASGILFCIVFYLVLFRSGLNRKASDPSLTIAQVVSAIVVLTIAMYHTSSSARAVILPIELMAYVFGVFRLSIRKLVYVALIAIICYALMLWSLLQFRPQEVDLQLEVGGRAGSRPIQCAMLQLRSGARHRRPWRSSCRWNLQRTLDSQVRRYA